MGIATLITGIAETAAGAVLMATGVGAPFGAMLLQAGVGTTLTGIGQAMEGKHHDGYATTIRNPISPWRYCYGKARVSGDLAYFHTWGDNLQMCDMIVLLADHRCLSIDEALMDMQRLQIDTNAIPTSASAGYSISAPASGAGTSFTPVQQTIHSEDITSISRDTYGVVTVVLSRDIPYLTAGDNIQFKSIAADASLNGTFQVAQILSQAHGSPGSISFTVLNGGVANSATHDGNILTMWQDRSRLVYFEPLYGNQTLGDTFVGQAAGTPWHGTGKLCTPLSPQNAGGDANPNPWTARCSLVGKTAAFIRMTYDKSAFPSGVPQLSFILRGKDDIFDPRTNTAGYTSNWALCLADFLHVPESEGGYGLAYGTEIDTDALIAAANICDEMVPLVTGGSMDGLSGSGQYDDSTPLSGYERRYHCHGQFTTDKSRGQTLQDMLTAGAGRIGIYDGKVFIQAGAYADPTGGPLDLQALSIGPIDWSPRQSVRDLYNAVKPTYISPENKWQSTDAPLYAQDTNHGYFGPSEYGGDINLAEDNGDRRILDIHLPFTTSSAAAQRIGKIELLRRRWANKGAGTFRLNMGAYQYTPLDILPSNCSVLGISAMNLEVTGSRLVPVKDDEVYAFSTELDMQLTDSSIYQWSIEEQLSPQGYRQAVILTPMKQASCFPWSPGYAIPQAGDALAGTAATFGVQPTYGADASGSATSAALITGYAPQAKLDYEVSPPQIFVSVGSGTIPAGDYAVALSAHDSGATDYAETAYQAIAIIHLPSAGGINVAINWGSGDDGGDLYLAKWDVDGYVFHHQSTVAPGTVTTSIGSFDQSQPGGPDELFDHFVVHPVLALHCGNFAAQVQAVTASTVTLYLPDSAADDWAGRTLSLLAKLDSTASIPYLNLPIASSAASDADGMVVFTIGAGPDGNTLPDLSTLLVIGDLLVMRLYPTFTASGFSDALIANGYYPDGATHVEAGHIAVCMTGANAGDSRVIASVITETGGKYTDFTLTTDWAITPATGDIVVIVAGSEKPVVASGQIANARPTLQTIEADVANLGDQTWLFRVTTADADGNETSLASAPMRDLYYFGNHGTRELVSTETDFTFDMLPTDLLVVCDCDAHPIVYNCLPFDDIPNQIFTVVKQDTSPYEVTIDSASDQDTFDDGTTSKTLSNVGDSFTFKVHGPNNG